MVESGRERLGADFRPQQNVVARRSGSKSCVDKTVQRASFGSTQATMLHLLDNVQPKLCKDRRKVSKGTGQRRKLVAYYPPKDLTFKNVQRMFPELGLEDLDERQRIADLALRKSRGKGPPPKANSPEESRRAAKKKR
ncbi:hypothetical protein PIIN_03618 [Serendipita indica DSM 11827]|uniref:Uncharacterized protein n=1 Tax=Serendipita indica (strain DSM 11827) TaxID=1109443 RepID=G4TEC4_SERID|nr:hypothetical protein PIIN_03618 [Serendipita indica DSM 11827]